MSQHEQATLKHRHLANFLEDEIAESIFDRMFSVGADRLAPYAYRLVEDAVDSDGNRYDPTVWPVVFADNKGQRIESKWR